MTEVEAPMAEVDAPATAPATENSAEGEEN